MASKAPGLDVEALTEGLVRAVRYCARASQLSRYAPELIDMLVPPTAYPELAVCDRALEAEAIIRAALTSIGGPTSEALHKLLGLAPGMYRTRLDHRRTEAGKVFDVDRDTFRRDWHEKQLIQDLAYEIYAQWRDDQVNPPET